MDSASMVSGETASDRMYEPAPAAPAGNTLQLVLGTGAFAVCFAIFGSVSAMMPELRKPERLNLSPLEVSLALALPVLLGSLGRIPLGIMTDRFGGRAVFIGVLVCSIVPALLMGWVNSLTTLLICGFFLGISLASFSVGVGFVSGWYAPQRQGFALGVYGAGNIGQSLAAFGAPLMVLTLGFAWGFWLFALLAALWLVFFLVAAADAPRRALPSSPEGEGRVRGSWGDFARPLAHTRSWILSLYYFLTFGGFVAMAIYLPIFLTAAPFGLSPADAGFRTAGFVLLATAMRPAGGILADRFGGQKILLAVFSATAAFALCMACPLMITFTIGALGTATAIGLGNGAVFKLVPESFPNAVGSVTGLVGAAGGLGGFFPPLALGMIQQALGSFTLGFVLLSLFSLLCLLVCWKSETGLKPRTSA